MKLNNDIIVETINKLILDNGLIPEKLTEADIISLVLYDQSLVKFIMHYIGSEITDTDLLAIKDRHISLLVQTIIRKYNIPVIFKESNELDNIPMDEELKDSFSFDDKDALYINHNLLISEETSPEYLLIDNIDEDYLPHM